MSIEKHYEYFEKVISLLERYGFTDVISIGGRCPFQIEAENAEKSLYLYFKARDYLELKVSRKGEEIYREFNTENWGSWGHIADDRDRLYIYLKYLLDDYVYQTSATYG